MAMGTVNILGSGCLLENTLRPFPSRSVTVFSVTW